VRVEWLPAALLFASTTLLYVWDLGRAPVYLGGDEAHFAVHADAVARTGRDLDGRVLPLLFSLADPLGDPNNTNASQRWYQPALLYLLAAALRVAPLSEALIRAPTAIIGGLINPLLTYLVALRLAGRRMFALVGAAAVALSPSHFILARQALDYVVPLPFVLAWLLCLLSYLDGGPAWLPLASGFVLGVGLFSYAGSWIVMPLCVVVACVGYAASGRGAVRAAALTIAGFSLPAAVLAGWLAVHPQVLPQMAVRYDVASAAPPASAAPQRRAGTLTRVRDKVSE
jgi:hypothetical protein